MKCGLGLLPFLIIAHYTCLATDNTTQCMRALRPSQQRACLARCAMPALTNAKQGFPADASRSDDTMSQYDATCFSIQARTMLQHLLHK
jgi:hypothetical protein